MIARLTARISLRGRLIMLLLAAFSIILAIIVRHAVEHRAELIDNAKSHLLYNAQIIAARQQYLMKHADQILVEMMHHPALRSGASGKECSHALLARMRQETEFVQLGKVLPDGNVACAAIPPGDHVSFADRNWFRQALKSERMVTGDVVIGRIVGKPVITFAKAIRDASGQASGVLYVSLDLALLQTELVKTSLPEGARLALIDNEGMVIARYPDPEGWAGKSAANLDIVKAILASGGEGTTGGIGLDGAHKVYGFTPLLRTVSGPLYLWLSMPEAAVTAQARHEIINLVVAVMTVLSVLGLVYWGSEKLLMQPLLIISRQMAKYSAGDISARTGLPHTDDEIGRLARMLDETAGRIEVGAQRFRTVADASLDTLFILKSVRGDDGKILDFEFTDVNTRAEAMLGMAREQIVGQKLCELLPINRSGGFFDKYVAIVETGTPLEEEFPIDAPQIKAQWLRHQVVRIGDGIAISSRDITAWKEASAEIGRLNRLRTHILNSVGEGIFGLDSEGRCTFINRAGAAMLGWPEEELLGQGMHALHHHTRADGTPYPREECPILSAYKDGLAHRGDDELYWKKDGTNFPVEYVSTPIRDERGELAGAVVSFNDISERKRVEQMLAASEEKFRSATETARDAFIIVGGKDGIVEEWNPAAEATFGYSREEAVGRGIHELIPAPHLREAARRGMEHFAESGEGAAIGQTLELMALHKDGHEFPVELSLSAMRLNGKWLATGIARNITERKVAEESLRLNSQMLDAANDSIFINDLDGNFVYLNEAAWKSRGYTRDELMATNLHALDVPEFENLIESRIKELMENRSAIFESAHRCKDGSLMPIEVSARIVETSGRKLVLAVARDITERKARQKALARALRALKTLSAGNRELVRATDELQLLKAACRVAVDEGGYRLATVGYADDNPEKTITPVAWAGFEEGYYNLPRPTWADTEKGQAPIARAIRSGKPEIARDIQNNSGFALWRDEAIKRGYASNLVMPLRDGARTFGGLSIYSSEPDAFDEEEVRLLSELGDDLAYGIETLRTRTERDRIAYAHEHHAEILRHSLEDALRAIAFTVEMRDPYTAGHERRVGELAVAIAGEMGLGEEKIHGIRLAATVHDLGKIQIPAEILAKPGKITEVEFMLIKTHPQAGYDILKGVEFPWPIANVVWQHHERLDGTGYPQGLKDGEILLESRIMAVADVVEAMASHRPYRPGLGIETALKEIERGKGSAYDVAVADACLKLFREGKFAFQG